MVRLDPQETPTFCCLAQAYATAAVIACLAGDNWPFLTALQVRNRLVTVAKGLLPLPTKAPLCPDKQATGITDCATIL